MDYTVTDWSKALDMLAGYISGKNELIDYYRKEMLRLTARVTELEDKNAELQSKLIDCTASEEV